MPYDSTPALPDDAVTVAVRRAIAASPPASPQILQAAEAVFAGAAAAPDHALDTLLRMIERHPSAMRLQLLAVRLLEAGTGREKAIGAWRALHQRFPRCPDALLVVLRWTQRHEGPAPATLLLANLFPEPPQDPDGMLLLARGLEELGHQTLADAAFARLSKHHSRYELGWLMHAQVLERRGQPWCAQQVAATGLATIGARPRLFALAGRLDATMRLLDGVVPLSARVAGEQVGGAVFRHLIQRASVGRMAPAPVRGTVGDILMVGSSLGAGGAERQMVATAIGLHAARQAGRKLAGHDLGGVRVVCRAVDDRPGGTFFLPELEQQGVPVACYARMAEMENDATALLRFLPPRIAEATARLTSVIRDLRPSTVQLWQDGTILACVLAALLADAPRIVLSVRSLPPRDRPERNRAEYEWLYPMLAQMPGVIWTANSHCVAARYAACFGIPEDRIRVVRNGIAPPPTRGSAASRTMLKRFQASAGRGFTLGGVMRLDDNKRPMLWLDVAEALLREMPEARCILVGDGALRPEVSERAAALGGRVLLTGRSSEVGFWLAQMDALLLLSRCEGLPNALLEAQLAGVPVVTTPAGGAAETVRHGETGFVLASAEAPMLTEAVARLRQIAMAGGRAGPLGAAARHFVAQNFSVEAMLEGMVESYVA